MVGLGVTGRSGDRVLLRAQVDRYGEGDLAVRIADGAVDVATGGR